MKRILTMLILGTMLCGCDLDAKIKKLPRNAPLNKDQATLLFAGYDQAKAKIETVNQFSKWTKFGIVLGMLAGIGAGVYLLTQGGTFVGTLAIELSVLIGSLILAAMWVLAHLWIIAVAGGMVALYLVIRYYKLIKNWFATEFPVQPKGFVAVPPTTNPTVTMK